MPKKNLVVTYKYWNVTLISCTQPLYTTKIISFPILEYCEVASNPEVNFTTLYNQTVTRGKLPVVLSSILNVNF